MPGVFIINYRRPANSRPPGPLLVILIYVIELIGIRFSLILQVLLFVNGDEQVIGVFQRAFFVHLQLALAAQVLFDLLKIRDGFVELLTGCNTQIGSFLDIIRAFAGDLFRLPLQVHTGIIRDLSQYQGRLRVIRLQLQAFLKIILRLCDQCVIIGRAVTRAGVGSILIELQSIVEEEEMVLGEMSGDLIIFGKISAKSYKILAKSPP